MVSPGRAASNGLASDKKKSRHPCGGTVRAEFKSKIHIKTPMANPKMSANVTAARTAKVSNLTSLMRSIMKHKCVRNTQLECVKWLCVFGIYSKRNLDRDFHFARVF
jgi:hypothetical protein